MDDKACLIACYVNQIEEPTSIEEAMVQCTCITAFAEFMSLPDNEICELVEPPPGKNTFGSKWVFKVK